MPGIGVYTRALNHCNALGREGWTNAPLRVQKKRTAEKLRKYRVGSMSGLCRRRFFHHISNHEIMIYSRQMEFVNCLSISAAHDIDAFDRVCTQVCSTIMLADLIHYYYSFNVICLSFDSINKWISSWFVRDSFGFFPRLDLCVSPVLCGNRMIDCDIKPSSGELHAYTSKSNESPAYMSSWIKWNS